VNGPADSRKAGEATHYDVLQVSRDAEPEVIARAYKALAMKYHPDRRPEGEKQEATARLSRINDAYAVLGDPSRRAAYDSTVPGKEASVSGWERFLDDGLVGLFLDWRRHSHR
jgi:curved DNA-binding protein CbpA